MGYISFLKASGEVDLLPAENVIHVSTASATEINIDYGVQIGDDKYLRAEVTYATTAAVTDPDVRKKVNAAIELANGASGPAVPVGLPTLVTSVDIEKVTIS